MLNRFFNLNKKKFVLEQVKTKRSKWWILVGILYLLSPIDILPDILPIMGYVDDVIVILYLINMFIGKDVSIVSKRFGYDKDTNYEKVQENTKDRITKNKGPIVDGEILD